MSLGDSIVIVLGVVITIFLVIVCLDKCFTLCCGSVDTNLSEHLNIHIEV